MKRAKRTWHQKNVHGVTSTSSSCHLECQPSMPMAVKSSRRLAPKNIKKQGLSLNHQLEWPEIELTMMATAASRLVLYLNLQGKGLLQVPVGGKGQRSTILGITTGSRGWKVKRLARRKITTPIPGSRLLQHKQQAQRPDLHCQPPQLSWAAQKRAMLRHIIPHNISAAKEGAATMVVHTV